ncbi:uncharacterized protein B0I36DRAFT_352571 [Microdochium trichocladiopsis]|uniref:Uncharacterized protein n=1 Tax=Microdochium trichocladiopsis TaxID=1682393 RepID=A0A9P9BIK1_9PEZI|nr:uncharacterized protein B0I36DRAFT_352571 [Microdochium trichocladiopsis]KAH7024323.1 hypothetical protein B0I36DRAFT_352571 [Microdochium trichocladiopsis]
MTVLAGHEFTRKCADEGAARGFRFSAFYYDAAELAGSWATGFIGYASVPTDCLEDYDMSIAVLEDPIGDKLGWLAVGTLIDDLDHRVDANVTRQVLTAAPPLRRGWYPGTGDRTIYGINIGGNAQQRWGNYPRQQAIKSRRGPHNFFSSWQSIEPLDEDKKARAAHDGLRRVPSQKQTPRRQKRREDAAELEAPESEEAVFKRDTDLRLKIMKLRRTSLGVGVKI